MTAWAGLVKQWMTGRAGFVKRLNGPTGVVRMRAGYTKRPAVTTCLCTIIPGRFEAQAQKTGRLQDCETPGLRLEECQPIRSAVTPPLFRYHNSSFPFCAAVLQYLARFLPMHQHAGNDPASIPRSNRGINYKFHSFSEIRKPKRLLKLHGSGCTLNAPHSITLH